MTTLVRWEPFRDVAALQSEMGRLMNGLFEGPSRVTQSWVPALDVWETDTELVYAFDLPGIPEEKIEIEVADDTLTVSAEREKVAEESGDRFYRFERRYGTEAFVEVLSPGSHPETRSVRASNVCRLAVHRPRGGDTVVVLSVIDNLVKGAAGQAIQNMNILFGLDERAGLDRPAVMP